MKSKRVVVISDLHCGHATGLTPPDYNPNVKFDGEPAEHDYRSTLWKFYADTITKLQPIDYLIVNGDDIAGPNKRWGGRQLIAVDVNQQVKMAVDAIQFARARNVYMSFGTPYHVGDSVDAESQIASDVGARKIGAQDTLVVNGVAFNYRHHVGGSQSPMGRQTSLSREKVWNLLWHERGQVKADIIIRSHVHYFQYGGDGHTLWMTTPALQGLGDFFGSRMMSGVVDYGLVHFDVADGDYAWEPHLLNGKTLLRRST